MLHFIATNNRPGKTETNIKCESPREERALCQWEMRQIAMAIAVLLHRRLTSENKMEGVYNNTDRICSPAIRSIWVHLPPHLKITTWSLPGPTPEGLSTFITFCSSSSPVKPQRSKQAANSANDNAVKRWHFRHWRHYQNFLILAPLAPFIVAN